MQKFITDNLLLPNSAQLYPVLLPSNKGDWLGKSIHEKTNIAGQKGITRSVFNIHNISVFVKVLAC